MEHNKFVNRPRCILGGHIYRGWKPEQLDAKMRRRLLMPFAHQSPRPMDPARGRLPTIASSLCLAHLGTNSRCQSCSHSTTHGALLVVQYPAMSELPGYPMRCKAAVVAWKRIASGQSQVVMTTRRCSLRLSNCGERSGQ